MREHLAPETLRHEPLGLLRKLAEACMAAGAGTIGSVTGKEMVTGHSGRFAVAVDLAIRVLSLEEKQWKAVAHIQLE